MTKVEDALKLGHDAAEVALAHAGEEFAAKAYAEFVAYARSHNYFTTFDVRRDSLLVPPDNRAWGAIARKAQKDGVVRGIGYIATSNLIGHGAPTTQWASI